jgi:uncharacterized membrane protein YbhN (UPF0104 family)
MRARTRYLSFILPVVISVGLLFLMYRNIGLRSLVGEMGTASPFWTGAYVLLSTVEPLVRGLRWSLLSGAPAGTAIRGLYVAKAGNNLLPLRMGDAVRAQYVKDRAGVPYSGAVASIFAESALDLLFLGAIVLFFALFAASRKGALLAGALLLGVPLAILAASKALGAVPDRLRRAGPLTVLGSVGLHLKRLFRSPSRVPVLLYTTLLWMLTLAASYCGLRMLLPSVSMLGVVSSIVFVYFSILVPSAPGFIGTYHAAMAGSLAVMGYDLAAYPAVPIAVHLLQFIPQTALGLIIGMGYLFSNDWRSALENLDSARRKLFGTGGGR